MTNCKECGHELPEHHLNSTEIKVEGDSAQTITFKPNNAYTLKERCELVVRDDDCEAGYEEMSFFLGIDDVVPLFVALRQFINRSETEYSA